MTGYHVRYFGHKVHMKYDLTVKNDHKWQVVTLGKFPSKQVLLYLDLMTFLNLHYFKMSAVVLLTLVTCCPGRILKIGLQSIRYNPCQWYNQCHMLLF